jgi:type I restriction enzyme S subunit
MMREKRNMPKLSFPEFNNLWIEKTLSELLEFKNGLNAPKENYGSGEKFINVLDIIQNDYLIHERIIGSVQVIPAVFEKYKVEFGDILFQRSSETREEVGQANVYLDTTRPATFGGFVIRGKKVGEYDPAFLNYLLKTQSSRNEITSKSGGSTRYNVGQETLSQVTITTTSLPEQQKIATFLTAVDRRIKLLEQKKEKLEAYKKGVMQQLFSRQIRFKQDDGSVFPEWVEKKLGEVAKFSKGKGISKSDISESGELKCIRYGQLYTEYGEVIDQVVSRTECKPSTLILSEANDVIIPSSGETQIDIARAACVLKSGIALGGDLNIIRSPLNGVFLSFYLNHRRKHQIAKMAQGISVVHLYNSQLVHLEIEIPCDEEQGKIVSFLRSLNEITEKLTFQINQTQTWKKGLLQQMFI